MFGRRRRPVLGAAVLVGASRAAARHEVRNQAVMDSQREMEIQREVEMRRRQEADQEERTQRAVEEAMKKAAIETQAAQQSAAAVDMRPLSTTPGQPYSPGMNASLGIQPEHLARVPSPQLPAYSSVSPLENERPKSEQGYSSFGPAMESKAQFCTQCGVACQVQDRFCRQCGAKRVS